MAAGKPEISAIVVCLNEEDNIGRCLNSLTWCDEIVVVDGGSRDATVAVARAFTDRVLTHAWPGYRAQKQFALDHARGEWVLNVDADERVSPELRREIEAVLQQPTADGYYIPRLVYYLGRWWWRGGWYPDYRLRLFRRDNVVWGGVDPHEKVILHGKSARLRGPMLHYTYRNISEHLATINGFTGVAARELLLRGKQASIPDLLLRPLWRFVRYYVMRLGFTEGIAGGPPDQCGFVVFAGDQFAISAVTRAGSTVTLSKFLPGQSVTLRASLDFSSGMFGFVCEVVGESKGLLAREPFMNVPIRPSLYAEIPVSYTYADAIFSKPP